MPCSHCDELSINITIARPANLEQVIRVVQGNLADGTLQEVHSPGKEPFSLALGAEGWPDILDYTFQCQHCGQIFKLFAETYRGSGGSWSPSA